MIEYWFDRFLFSPFVPAALLLTLIAAWPHGRSATDVLIGCVFLFPIVLLALAQLRLWDDLADRERDRRDHPERVLCDANPAPFVVTAILLAGANLWLISVLGDAHDVLRFLALNVAVGAYYVLRPNRRTATSDALLLVKYPALVLVLTPITTEPAAIAINVLATYTAAFAYELWHDPTGPLRTNS